MKRTFKTTVQAQKGDESSDIDMDCSCQILYDTSLSNVGDSDCDCSECLEANLNAFNQFKNQAVKTHDTTHQNAKNNRGKSSQTNKKAHQNKTGHDDRKQSRPSLNRYKSTDRIPSAGNKTRRKFGSRAENQEIDDNNFREFEEGNQFTNGQLNDFLLITQHRTRKYLNQRKLLEQHDKKQKQELKDKIKKNLEMLKYTVQMNREQIEEQQIGHKYKWGHNRYQCQCNGDVDKQHRANNKCCVRKCRKQRKITKTLDTNLHKFKQNFNQNRDQYLKQIREKREEEHKMKQKIACPDMCPNHHNRTDKHKIKQIEEYIKKNIKNHEAKLKKQKKEKEDKQKAIEGKLKAIDIKSKQKLQKSKKHDPGASRTTFRLSIDNYDTFSELRQENQRRKHMKQVEREAKKAINSDGGAKLLEKVYQQDDDENIQFGQFDPKNTKKPELNYTSKQKVPQLRKDQLIYERIAYDAQLHAPKNVKNKQKPKPDKVQTKRNTKAEIDKKNNLSKGKQQQQKKRIEQQIQRKKKQILKQFQKRNSNNSKNTQLRRQYEQKLDKQSKKTKNIATNDRSQNKKDPYRTNYQTKAGKNNDQIRVHGDPLLQEYDYHHNLEQAKSRKGDNMGIFTQNVHSLSSKTRLKP